MGSDANNGSTSAYFPKSYHKAASYTKTTPPIGGGRGPSCRRPLPGHQECRLRSHGGRPKGYVQVRELYQRVLSDMERKNLHSLSARLLKRQRRRPEELPHQDLHHRSQLRQGNLRSPDDDKKSLNLQESEQASKMVRTYMRGIVLYTW